MFRPSANPLSGRYLSFTEREEIGTLVERMTRFTLLLYLPRMPGYGRNARVKNGPALAGQWCRCGA
jgi:hypothetical protein